MTVIQYRHKWDLSNPTSLPQTWCPLGRHWFMNWGGNSAQYRDRTVCTDCRTKLKIDTP